ncbi:PilX N-terminal domain-containing pilus assembly protein [Noviherbaspirillum malthae]|uniref:PilX N-terminal domain-containing pilus assembly protein n=1 Tax=Noviherbaspirillum malthae TaxID=1260987 RepID=UPI00188E5974|nr:PilX N-terminal domain-containing pilus assembly protein [Noviherbaspirillum malthae]
MTHRFVSVSRSQRGATLIVGLILLTLITLTVTAAFKLSHLNQKTVSNMQYRNEAIAAANKALEQVISSPFTTSPAAEEINVDINHDNQPDYVVKIDRPTCIRALEIAGTGAAGSGSSSELEMPVVPPNYTTTWDIAATVTDAKTGTSVSVRHGVQVQLNQIQYQAVCA